MLLLTQFQALLLVIIGLPSSTVLHASAHSASSATFAFATMGLDKLLAACKICRQTNVCCLVRCLACNVLLDKQPFEGKTCMVRYDARSWNWSITSGNSRRRWPQPPAIRSSCRYVAVYLVISTYSRLTQWPMQHNCMRLLHPTHVMQLLHPNASACT